jgi:hypothetical protein
MKVLAGIQSVKDRILNAKLLLTEDDCPPEVRKAIESIKQKMLQCKLS